MAYELIGGETRDIATKLYRADTTADLEVIKANEKLQGLRAECEVVEDGSFHKLNSQLEWKAQP